MITVPVATECPKVYQQATEQVVVRVKRHEVYIQYKNIWYNESSFGLIFPDVDVSKLQTVRV